MRATSATLGKQVDDLLRQSQELTRIAIGLRVQISIEEQRRGTQGDLAKDADAAWQNAADIERSIRDLCLRHGMPPNNRDYLKWLDITLWNTQ